MTEKKTFKNAYILNEIRGDYHEGDMDWKIYQSEGFGETTGQFESDKWDMEVTFTKKVPKPEVGGTCRLNGWNDGVTYTILAVDNDLVWIRDQNETHEENTGWIEPVSHLKDMKPWNPA